MSLSVLHIKGVQGLYFSNLKIHHLLLTLPEPADADTNPDSCRNRIICLAQIECLAADIGYECPSGFRVDDCGCQVAGCQCGKM